MASSPSPIDLGRIAALARLELTPDEARLFAPQLDAILTYARHVQDVDTTGVPPTSHPTSEGPRWRDDAPRPSLDRDEVLANAPGGSPDTGLFKVPKVLG